jgi:hypothetical protein
LKRHPQPVPPVYQPEVAARAIAYAAEHPRRELWVGGATVYTILGEKFISGVIDRYLGRMNEKAQPADIPIDPAQRKDNLFKPPPGNPRARPFRRDGPRSQPAVVAERASSARRISGGGRCRGRRRGSSPSRRRWCCGW